MGIGNTRVTLLMRGMTLPPWHNKTANQALATMLRREKEAELAKLDFEIYSWAVIHGIDKASFDKKMKTLENMKESLTAIVTQEAYDPTYKKIQLEKIMKERELDTKIMDKVKALDKLNKEG